jgi:uncharacterized repeat protein (TIGR01451 family)
MAMLCAGMHAGAQGISLLISASPNPVVVSNSLTLTIAVTNRTGVTLQNVGVTNIPSPIARFVSASGSFGFGTNNNVIFIFFNVGQLTAGAGTQLTLAIEPLKTGFQTNFFSAGSSTITNVTITNIATQVAGPQNSLVVSLTGLPAIAFSNDWVTYHVVVTNSGSGSLQNVMLTNALPPSSLKVISVSPTNQAPFTNNNLVFNIGTLAGGGASKSFQVTVQPTNTGVLTFSAFVSTAGLLDTNSVTESTSADVTVEDFSGTLIATNLSPMVFDPQTGLMNQTIRLSNIGTNAVASARVIVSGLTNRLYNAVGTNNGNPFVVYGNTLDTNQSVDMVLEYFVPTRLPIVVSNSQYLAVGIPAVDFTVPGGTNGTFLITTNVAYPNAMLIEFESVPGRTYTVYYSDDPAFTTVLAAQPSITAQANKTQWIDDGPPKTVSLPSTRFYRVFRNP